VNSQDTLTSGTDADTPEFTAETLPVKTPLDQRSIAQLVSDLAEQTARLVRAEAQLAAREMGAKAKQAALGGGAFGVAAVLAGYGGLALLACAVLALATVVAPWLAALIVGGALGLLAVVAAVVGKAKLSAALPPVPSDTIARVQEDIVAVKDVQSHDTAHLQRKETP